MARALKSRIVKLERDNGDTDGDAFYLLWVSPGENHATALAGAKRRSKCPEGVPIYCAEWKAPENFTWRGRALGPRPPSRLTNQRRLSEDEVAVLFEAIGDDYESSGLSSGDPLSHDVGSDAARKMTDRELIGAILSASDNLIWSPGHATPSRAKLNDRTDRL